MDTFKRLLTKHKTNVKDNTKNTYIANFKKVINSYAKDYSLEEINKNIKTIVENIINDNKGKKTLVNYLYVLRVLYELLDIEEPNKYKKEKDYITEIHGRHITKYKYDYQTNQTTEKLKDIKWTIDSIAKKIEELPEGDMTRLIVEFYIDRPPRNDLNDVKIYTNKEEFENKGNYIVVREDGATLVLNDYKTAKEHGQIRKEVNDRTFRNLRESLRQIPRRHLFVNEKTKLPYTEKSFNQFINRKFKKLFDDPKFTINTFRHLYATSIKDKTYEEKEEIAKVMGHKTTMQKNYEIEFRDDLIKKLRKEIDEKDKIIEDLKKKLEKKTTKKTKK